MTDPTSTWNKPLITHPSHTCFATAQTINGLWMATVITMLRPAWTQSHL
jgi:hypothetical protein